MAEESIAGSARNTGATLGAELPEAIQEALEPCGVAERGEVSERNDRTPSGSSSALRTSDPLQQLADCAAPEPPEPDSGHSLRLSQPVGAVGPSAGTSRNLEVLDEGPNSLDIIGQAPSSRQLVPGRRDPDDEDNQRQERQHRLNEKLHIDLILSKGVATIEEDLEHGADSNASSLLGTALQLAIEYAHPSEGVQVVQCLLKFGADPNSVSTGNRMPPIFMAFLHDDILRALIDKGANMDHVSPEEDPLLHYAARLNCQPSNVEAMIYLKRPELLEKGDKDGCTPLVKAAEYGNVDRVHFLLSLIGANAAATDRSGRTVLHLLSLKEDALVRAASLELKERLIVNGLLEARDQAGHTALHLAAGEPSLEGNLNILLSWGARTDAKSQVHCTPLHLAAARHNRPGVQALFKAGAARYATDGGDKTPYQRAVLCSCQDPVLLAVLAFGDIDAKRHVLQRLRDVSNSATQTAAVVAVLIATVSYTALLSPPGGWAIPVAYEEHGSTIFEGADPIFLPPFSEAAATNATAFWIFMGFNTIALASSIVSLLLLLILHFMLYSWSNKAEKEDLVQENGEVKVSKVLLTWGLVFLCLGVVTLLAAGIAGPFVVFYQTNRSVARWLAGAAGMLVLAASLTAGGSAYHAHRFV